MAVVALEVVLALPTCDIVTMTLHTRSSHFSVSTDTEKLGVALGRYIIN